MSFSKVEWQIKTFHLLYTNVCLYLYDRCTYTGDAAHATGGVCTPGNKETDKEVWSAGPSDDDVFVKLPCMLLRAANGSCVSFSADVHFCVWANKCGDFFFEVTTTLNAGRMRRDKSSALPVYRRAYQSWPQHPICC